MATPATELDVDGIEVRLSSPDKVYFPELGLTKKDLADYLLTVGEGSWRGCSGVRPPWSAGPAGAGGDEARHPIGRQGRRLLPEARPGEASRLGEVAEIRFPSGRKAWSITPANLATVVWALNLGCLRFHPWPVTAPDVDQVDQLRIDLDPQPGTDFDDVVAAALELRNVMGELGLDCYPKTSGGRGMHVFSRIEPASFVDARHAAIAIGRELAHRMPDRVTVDWGKETRGERVFVDYNQMARDRLMASPYSIRPVPTARVSAP